ncbi:MAG: hypothetical protein D3923_07375 [Candidatus Electrothrix sp. AR3]|nr:hypothetical protein [Candidatus Electrothrix sp. AR3]
MKLINDQNKFFILYIIIIIFCVVETAQGSMRQNLEKNITITGIMQASYTASPPGTNNKGLHIQLTSDTVEYIIHVSPQWYVDNHPELFNFKKGDLLTVSGAKFTSGRTLNNIYAASITNHSSGVLKLQLRDPKTGVGLWSGRFKDQMKGIIKNKTNGTSPCNYLIFGCP